METLGRLADIAIDVELGLAALLALLFWVLGRRDRAAHLATWRTAWIARVAAVPLGALAGFLRIEWGLHRAAAFPVAALALALATASDFLLARGARECARGETSLGPRWRWLWPGSALAAVALRLSTESWGALVGTILVRVLPGGLAALVLLATARLVLRAETAGRGRRAAGLALAALGVLHLNDLGAALLYAAGALDPAWFALADALGAILLVLLGVATTRWHLEARSLWIHAEARRELGATLAQRAREEKRIGRSQDSE